MSSSSGSTLKLGNSGGGDRTLPGLMQGVQIHNVALTEDEVLQASKGLPVTRGLVAKYNMTEGSGTTITDSSGNGFNGTLTAGAWQSLTIARSKTATARTASGARTAA